MSYEDLGDRRVRVTGPDGPADVVIGDRGVVSEYVGVATLT